MQLRRVKLGAPRCSPRYTLTKPWVPPPENPVEPNTRVIPALVISPLDDLIPRTTKKTSSPVVVVSSPVGRVEDMLIFGLVGDVGKPVETSAFLLPGRKMMVLAVRNPIVL